MPPRLTLDTLDSLHLTLQRLEQASNSAEDQQAMADLKTIILNRRAELEVLQALGQEDNASTAEMTQPADLVAPSTSTKNEYSAPSPDTLELEKLN